MVIEQASVFLAAAGAGLLRNVAGWLENAMEDGKISDYEWGLLGATVTRTVVLTVGLYYGLGLEPLAAASCGVVSDLIINALKGKKKALKR